MPRYWLDVEYDGTPFAGLQFQENAPSVQGVIEEAVYRFCGERPTLQCAGRTDAGVHAFGQVCHIDLETPRRVDKIRDAVNFHVRPWPVSILDVKEMPDDWHARFSARKRHYLYRILDRRPPPVIDRERVWHTYLPLDVERMQVAANHLLGDHDFTTFRSAHCQGKSPQKTLERLDVTRVGNEIHVHASARSFLHHQVRSFVGTLKLVGEGVHGPEWVKEILEARDRTRCGPVAPACGLYFMKVDYD